jgi:uncharacterized membrane protein YkvA (DUF1232 family)
VRKAYKDAMVCAGFVVAYAFSPIELIYQIPVLGYLDDLVIFPLGSALAIELIPPQILAGGRAEARGAKDRMVGRVAAVVVVAVWLVTPTF